MHEQINIFPLGESAATVEPRIPISFPLNEKLAIMQQWLWKHSFHGLRDVIVTHSSLTIYYDACRIKKEYQPSHTVFEWVQDKLRQAWQQAHQENGAGDDLPFFPSAGSNTCFKRGIILYNEYFHH